MNQFKTAACLSAYIYLNVQVLVYSKYLHYYALWIRINTRDLYAIITILQHHAYVISLQLYYSKLFVENKGSLNSDYS